MTSLLIDTSVPTNDVWIASTAMQHGYAILTLDRHFQFVRQILVKLYGIDTETGI